MFEVERILKIIEKESSNPSVFADNIGISRASMNHILNRRNNPSLDVITKILEKYDTINPEWLLFGKEPMYKGKNAFIQPSLFDEKSIVQDKDKKAPEYRRDTEIKKTLEREENTENKYFPPIVDKSKKISQIMIFYSDHTYEIFKP